MTTTPAPDVTHLLLAWRRGEPDALDRLLPLVYSELRKLAHARMRAESSGPQTLQTTALVHEAYVRLVDGTRVEWQNRAHFYAVCARLMRRILVDRARARCSLKRGGQGREMALGDWQGMVPAKDEELLALEDALQRLSKSDPRKGQVVELRYYGGLTLDETAEALGLSAETVTRDWRVARLWLAHELGGQRATQTTQDQEGHRDEQES
ncbi:MAG: sigma-70 family RNA polymerase sigma factor [Bacteroidales bacterium]